MSSILDPMFEFRIHQKINMLNHYTNGTMLDQLCDEDDSMVIGKAGAMRSKIKDYTDADADPKTDPESCNANLTYAAFSKLNPTDIVGFDDDDNLGWVVGPTTLNYLNDICRRDCGINVCNRISASIAKEQLNSIISGIDPFATVIANSRPSKVKIKYVHCKHHVTAWALNHFGPRHL